MGNRSVTTIIQSALFAGVVEHQITEAESERVEKWMKGNDAELTRLYGQVQKLQARNRKITEGVLEAIK